MLKDMMNSLIYTSEPMATRALAAEIRQSPDSFLKLLRTHSPCPLPGEVSRVQCEALANVDVLLELEDDGGTPLRVGIEAKFNHELSRQQIARETAALEHLIVLVTQANTVPPWLQREFPDVPVITWTDALACFSEPRITAEDIGSIKIPKAVVEARLNALSFGERLEGWDIHHGRNRNGNPSVVIESPKFASTHTLRGQVQVVGRGVPASLDDVRFESHIGVAVPELPENYFDPSQSDVAPTWVENLRTLQREVLNGCGDHFQLSRRAPGTSQWELGQWKTPIAVKHLREHAYLAKGYTDGWAVGPKTRSVPLARLDELAAITAELFERWYEAETR